MNIYLVGFKVGFKAEADMAPSSDLPSTEHQAAALAFADSDTPATRSSSSTRLRSMGITCAAAAGDQSMQARVSAAHPAVLGRQLMREREI